MGPQPERLAKWTRHLVQLDEHEKYLLVGFENFLNVNKQTLLGFYPWRCFLNTNSTYMVFKVLFVCLVFGGVHTCVLVSMHMCEGTPEYRNQMFLYLYQISLGHSLLYYLVKIQLYPFPFPPSKLSHVPLPLAGSQNDGFFSLLLLCICVCMCVCICIFIYKYINITCSLHLVLLACVGILRLNIWYWITKEGPIPG